MEQQVLQHLPNQPPIIEEAVKLYKNSESARTALKNQIISMYNTLTNSDSFQLGKCAVGGVMLYYGMKQLHSLTSPVTAGMNLPQGAEFRMQVGENPFAEKNPKQIYSFLKNGDKFKEWLKEPVTKAGIKIVVGTILLKKPTMELVALYNRAVKKFL